MKTDDYGKHLVAVEDLIQTQALMESQITSIGETIRRLNRHATPFISSSFKDAPLLEKRVTKLNAEYER